MKNFSILILLVSFSAFSGDFYTSDDFLKPSTAKTKPNLKAVNNTPPVLTPAIDRAEVERLAKIEVYIKKHSQYSKFKKAAINKELEIGMPYELVIISNGEPYQESETVTSWGSKTRLVMYGKRSIHFKNDLVESWTSFKR